jgi:hypothetical protein
VKDLFRVSSGDRKMHPRWPMTLGFAAAGLVILSDLTGAWAQTLPAERASAKLVTVLTLGLPCGADLSTREAVHARSLESGAAPEDLRLALDRISSDRTVCEPIRNAASRLMADLAVAAAREVETDDEAALAASATMIAKTLEAADRRAREQGFQVGPPPRNLTRGRIWGS